jgi:hypothetical protein
VGPKKEATGRNAEAKLDACGALSPVGRGRAKSKERTTHHHMRQTPSPMNTTDDTRDKRREGGLQGQTREEKRRQAKTRQDKTRHVTTRHDTTRQEIKRHDKTRQNKTRNYKTRPAKTRQDKTRQDKTRLD